MGNGAAALRDVELAGPEAGAATQGELVAYVAHELRAPLASIKAYTEILLDDAEPESQRAAFLATINQEADYLTGLIDSLLNVARIESGQLRLHATDVDLPALLAAVQPAFAPPLAARELAWAVTIAEGVPALRGDPDLLAILLRNLLANAVAHNRRGGRVIVELAPAPGGGVRLTVGDEGAGVPEEERERIFEKFYRVAAPSGDGARGSGLGLYLVRWIAALHGGTATVESTGSAGSRFAVTLRDAPPDDAWEC